MKRTLGFTLIELLVVIAIISILAAIVVPRVGTWISRANMTRAASEVRGIDLALSRMLSDAGRRDFSQMFSQQTVARLRQANEQYNTFVLYELLRNGRTANADGHVDFGGPGVGLVEGVRTQLGTQYMDVPLDPWDQRYQFFPGPWPTGEPIVLRSYRSGIGDRLDPDYQPYVYNQDRRAEADARIPGNPRADDLYGFPAPRDLPFYIWSKGQNMLDDQEWWRLVENGNRPERGYEGGGDDINNWDNQSGWETFYN